MQKTSIGIITILLLMVSLIAACDLTKAQEQNSQAAALTVSPSPAPTTEFTALQREGWILTWYDTFSDKELNTRNWVVETGGNGWGNNELQLYTNHPDNLRIEEGMLIIEAYRERYQRHEYTSARIKTQFLRFYKYGRVEARIKIPSGQGLWPAFWMLGTNFPEVGWPACGEIDIMENVGFEPNRVHASAHGVGNSGSNSMTGYYDAPAALSEDFHVYAIEWSADEIRWFFDGQEYYRISSSDMRGEWVFDHPFFIIINLAVGGNWPGSPDETTQFPQQMLVDYVSVYQRPK